MGIKETANQTKVEGLAQYVSQLKKLVANFEVFGLGLIDHPISGLATEFARFHDHLEAAENKMRELSSVAQVSQAAPVAQPAPAAPVVPGQQ